MLLSWYVNRFLALRGTAFRDPKSYFHRYAQLTDEEATATANSIWNRMNLVNLRENILPTRQRADLILTKNESQEVRMWHCAGADRDQPPTDRREAAGCA